MMKSKQPYNPDKLYSVSDIPLDEEEDEREIDLNFDFKFRSQAKEDSSTKLRVFRADH